MCVIIFSSYNYFRGECGVFMCPKFLLYFGYEIIGYLEVGALEVFSA